MFNKPILIDEILESIYNLKSGKSQDTDGIGAEFYLKNTCFEIAPVLCYLINDI